MKEIKALIHPHRTAVVKHTRQSPIQVSLDFSYDVEWMRLPFKKNRLNSSGGGLTPQQLGDCSRILVVSQVC